MHATHALPGFCCAALVFAASALAAHAPAFAHCDTVDGPVVKDAKSALEKGDVTPVLKWVGKEQEPEVRAAFQKAVAVRRKGDDARDLADTAFFETLVRVHRAGEGFAYTGLKPAGSDLSPAVQGADKAIEAGSVDGLQADLVTAVGKALQERFRRVQETRKHKDESVEAGREYVKAYVEYVHFAEKLEALLRGPSHDHAGAPAPTEADHKTEHETAAPSAASHTH